ncbi:MAG: hypothetical protein ACRDI0_06780 [Actinomycetota bacterium]
MTTVQIAGIVLGALFGLMGVSATATSLRETTPERSGRVRLLLAIHDAAKAGFWFALAAVLVALSLVDNPFEHRWLGLVPVVLAGVRLGAAYWLSRT